MPSPPTYVTLCPRFNPLTNGWLDQTTVGRNTAALPARDATVSIAFFLCVVPPGMHDTKVRASINNEKSDTYSFAFAIYLPSSIAIIPGARRFLTETVNTPEKLHTVPMNKQQSQQSTRAPVVRLLSPKTK